MTTLSEKWKDIDITLARLYKLKREINTLIKVYEKELKEVVDLIQISQQLDQYYSKETQ
jgi:hypothetical protein